MEWVNDKKKLREHLLTLTKELVSLPSHSHEPDKIMQVMEYIQAYFQGKNVRLSSFMSAGIPSLVITMGDTKHPDILLSGHVDVVPSSQRYAAIEEGNLLYGSGALDMKGGIAVMMALMDHFSTLESRPSLALMITADEEVGSVNGTKMLLEQEGYRANFAIINEGRRKYDLVIREKGVLTLTLQSEGNFIHSAYPWLGRNAIEELMRFLLELKRKFPKPADKWTPSMTVTIISAGKEENTIPGIATAVLNFRLTVGKLWTKEKVIAKVEALLTKCIKITQMEYSEIFEADTRNTDLQLLKKSGEAVLGHKLNYGENHGSSDAKIFAKHGIPTAILGPAGRDHHSPNEVLEIDSLPTHFEVLKKFIEAYHERKSKLLTSNQ